MRIALIYGTAAPAGRLATAMAAFGDGLRNHRDVETVTIDLSENALPFAAGAPLDSLPQKTRDVIDITAQADAVIIFSPVYRASIPGSLKNLFDLLPIEALEAKPVGAVAMGATPHHFLAVDLDLHPILSWFGAVAIPGIYLTSQAFASGVPTDETAGKLTAYGATVVDIARRLHGTRIEPRPLAAGPSR